MKYIFQVESGPTRNIYFHFLSMFGFFKKFKKPKTPNFGNQKRIKMYSDSFNPRSGR